MNNRDAGPTQGNPSHTSLKQAQRLMRLQAANLIALDIEQERSLEVAIAVELDLAWLSGFEDGQSTTLLQKVREAE